MNSLKSYHALKSEQSRIFGISLKDEVIQTLKEMLKKETLEARKFITKGKQNDLDMKLLVDKIETVVFEWKILLIVFRQKRSTSILITKQRKLKRQKLFFIMLNQMIAILKKEEKWFLKSKNKLKDDKSIPIDLIDSQTLGLIVI